MRRPAHSGKIPALFIPSPSFIVPTQGGESFVMQAEQIKALIESAIPDSQAQVAVQGDHISLVVVSPAFAGLNAVKKQQLVYAGLAACFADGSIHAVDSMKTLTPEEWQQQQQQ